MSSSEGGSRRHVYFSSTIKIAPMSPFRKALDLSCRLIDHPQRAGLAASDGYALCSLQDEQRRIGSCCSARYERIVYSEKEL